MTAPISATPWDLRSGEKWKIESADMRLGGDHNNEVIVDAKGNVVAYVSGNNDEGGNGALLAAAPALVAALKEAESFLSESFGHANAPHDAGGLALLHVVQAALKKAGAL